MHSRVAAEVRRLRDAEFVPSGVELHRKVAVYLRQSQYTPQNFFVRPLLTTEATVNGAFARSSIRRAAKGAAVFFAARLQPSQAASAAYVSPGARQSGACHVRVLRRNE